MVACLFLFCLRAHSCCCRICDGLFALFLILPHQFDKHGTGNLQFPGDLGTAHAPGEPELVILLEIFRQAPLFPSLVYLLQLGQLNAFPLAFQDGLPLELGDDGQHIEDHSAGRRAGIYVHLLWTVPW